MGLGILVTAILFSIGLIFYKPTMSDEEIKKRAVELGMTETDSNTSAMGEPENADESSDNASDSSTTDTATDTNDTTNVDNSSENTDEANTTTTENPDGSTTTVTETNADDPANENKVTTGSGTVDTASSNSDGEVGTITVTAGDDSMDVVQNLYKQGIITDPTDFNKYLESNKYDRYIKNGTYSIKKGASYDEIVHTITSQ